MSTVEVVALQIARVLAAEDDDRADNHLAERHQVGTLERVHGKHRLVEEGDGQGDSA